MTNNLGTPEVRVEYNSESYQKNSGFEMEWNFNRLIINKFFSLNLKLFGFELEVWV